MNKKKIIRTILVYYVFFFLLILFLYNYKGQSYSADTCQAVKNGTKKLSYETFGAIGDGVTNDYAAIKSAHDCANSLNKEDTVVYACNSDDCSSKTYYIGSGETVTSFTNIDWQNSNFIIDDYIDENGDSINDVTTDVSLFKMSNFIRNNLGNIYFQSNDNVFSPSQLNKSYLANAIKCDIAQIRKETNSLSDISTCISESTYGPEFLKYDMWAVYIYDNGDDNVFMRQGYHNGEDSGIPKQEMIIIDKNGNLLTPIT